MTTLYKFLTLFLGVLIFGGCNTHTSLYTYPQTQQVHVTTIGEVMYEHTINSYTQRPKWVTQTPLKAMYENQTVTLPSNQRMIDVGDSICNQDPFNSLEKRLIASKQLCFKRSSIRMEDLQNAQEPTQTFTKQLVYEGVADNILQLTYQELGSRTNSNQAFYHKLSFILNANSPTTIRFKNLEFEIIEATPKELKYRKISRY
jgi:hypothetical protein